MEVRATTIRAYGAKNMTRYTDADREKWDAAPEKSKRCEDCGLDPEECNCEKELDDIL